MTRETIAFKLDSKTVDAAPHPRPFRETWVYSPRVEGVHLRFAPIARGGIRWSDRVQDFRTEVLGLVRAQVVKNAVIVPSGAKGGFLPKQLPRAGSREEVAHLAVEMVSLEGATQTASIVGQSLRTSPQLAALANGVAAHAMDYDFTFLSGQAVSPVIPALLPLAESTGASPADCVAAFIVGAEVAARLLRASPRLSNDGGWHSTGTVGASILRVRNQMIPHRMRPKMTSDATGNIQSPPVAAR